VLPKLKTMLPLIAAGLLLALLIVPPLLSADRPETRPVDGHLRECPDTPNCVSSQTAREASRVEPLALAPGAEPYAAFQKLLARLDSETGSLVVWRHPPAPQPTVFAHVEFVTPWLRFRDDVELLLDPEARVVHVRSASRVGYSDLGANRKRVEGLRALLAAQP